MMRASLRALAGSSLGLALLASPAVAQFTIAEAQLADPVLADALDVGAYSLQSLQMPTDLDANVEIDVVIDGQPQTLALYPWSVRSSEHFEVLVQGEDGEYSSFDPGPSQIWRGVVIGATESRISAVLKDGQLDAQLRLTADGEVWAIQPLRDVDPTAAADLHVVYSSADGVSKGQTCGGALEVQGGIAPPPSTPSGFSGLADDKVCEIACDADVEFYNKNGSSVANTENDIELIIDRVQNIYQDDVSIIYEITTIIVRTSEPDPYGSSNAGTLLNQFVSQWNNNHQGIQRDVAHLFTGKNIIGGTIGIAFLNVICNLGSAYGLSESRFTNNLNFRTGLTAHELGHNWAAGHCDGAGDCWIMCSGIGGCAGSVTQFGQGSKNTINNKKNSSNCLDDAVPPPPSTITSLSSNQIGPLGGQVTVTGTGLTGATSATVGGQAATVIPQNDTTVIVNVPAAQNLGVALLTVSNQAGPSNSLPLTYVVSNPPVATAPTLINTTVDTLATWQFAANPSDTVFFLLDLDPGTFTYKSFTVLDTPIPLLTIPTNGAGVGTVNIPIDPSMGGVGLYTVFTQFVFIAPPIYHASNTLSTLVF